MSFLGTWLLFNNKINPQKYNLPNNSALPVDDLTIKVRHLVAGSNIIRGSPSPENKSIIKLSANSNQTRLDRNAPMCHRPMS